MTLRCLLFSSHKELVQPIWQVLADLGIEGEHCDKAVDAIKNVTLGGFQIVITDWEDQPEAEFLLKTAHELKAVLRPLTLAMVSDDTTRSQALHAGANSILLKPLRPEQLRETMSTACELLRSKLTAAMPARETMGTMAAAAGAVVAPAAVRQAPGKIHTGEFLQSSGPAPGAQFDTEPESATGKETAVMEGKAVTELEPMAASPATSPTPTRKEAVTGWAMLQAKLTTARSHPLATSLANGKTRFSSATASPGKEEPEQSDSQGSGRIRTQDFGFMPEEPANGQSQAGAMRRGRGKFLAFAALAAACVAVAAVPSARPRLLALYQKGVRAGSGFLNPPPPALPQPVAVHDSFGQSGDEYNLPAPGNIPDATTDPSQIRVVAVIDPTAKVKKGEATTNSESGIAVETAPLTEDSSAPNAGSQEPIADHELSNAAPASVGDAPANSINAPTDQAAANSEPAASKASPVEPHFPIRPFAPKVAAAIPRSLQSRVASSVPQASGSKPIEAAMSSIEPVKVPEPVEREFLIHPVDAVYPSATANGQRGTVVLQVLVGRDGSVQDAQFLQGSLLFARNAIDAARQYRFKPYLMNGRPVSVQSVLTLNFKPPV